MAAANTSKRLKEVGCNWTVVAFQRFLDAEFKSKYPRWTLDELLVHPMEAHGFCEYIRETEELMEAADDLILRSLLAYRKRFNQTKRAT